MKIAGAFLIAVAGLLGLVTEVTGQTRGAVRGRIIDVETKEGLPSVNVKIKGTYYGAASDVDGYYRIERINPGIYTLELTIIGYKMVQRTDVRVNAGETLIIDQGMQETILSLGQEIVVVGEKPLFNPEETSSRRVMTSEDLKATVVQDVRDVVTQQVGVVHSDNEVHIRGGRTHENAFLLDGVSVQDPLAGTGFGLLLSADAIQEVEVVTGGYNAEYGQATSGVVNVTTKEGSQKYSLRVSHKRDRFPRAQRVFETAPDLYFSNKPQKGPFNTEIYEATVSGPEPLSALLFPVLGVPGSISFFSNFYGGFTDGFTKVAARQLFSSTFYGSRFAPRQDNNWFWLTKATWRVSPLMRLAYSYNHSVAINQNSQTLQTNLEYVESSPGYQFEFQNILDEALTYTHNNQFHSLNWTHTLSNTLFYEVKVSHFFTHLRADANGKYFSEYREPKDIVTFPVEYFNKDRDTVGVIPGDGLYDYGNGFTWHDHYVRENTIKIDVTNHFSEANKFKTGIEMSFQEMQNIDIYQPWAGLLGLNNDIYKVNPAFGAMYVQDNITFSGMILNVGLRFDYWFPGKYVDDAVNNPDVITIPDKLRQEYREDTFNFFGHRWKGRISPRIGISHPVSDNQMLFFSYGHFSKRPKPQFVYAKLSPNTSRSTFQKFGNPNLNPETTVAYEIGLQTQFTNNDVLTVTAYYKDIFDYVSTRQARITTARLSTGNFVTYVNQDYARSRGIEAEFKKRIGQWFRGSVSGTYAITTGKSSTPDQGLLVARGDEEETIKENFVVWDRPFQFNLTTTFNVLPGEPLFGIGHGVLDDITVYVRAFYQSGKRYTPYDSIGTLANGRVEYVADRSNRLGKVGQDWFYVDMNVEKYVKIAGIELTLALQVKNIFDRKNSSIINPITGRAYEYDRSSGIGDPTPTSWNDPMFPDLQAPVVPFPFNPARYLSGRNIVFGVTIRF